MKKKNLLIVFLALLLLLMSMPMTVSAAIGSTNTKGAVIPKYKKVIVKNVDPAKFDKTFNEALLEAGENANKEIQYKIVIPPGNYSAGRLYKIPSNTFIYAKGATINATGTRVGMVITNPTKSSENIIIEGGTWSTLQQPNSVDGTVFRFLGVDNMMLKDMVIKTKRKSHIVEVADMNGFTVIGCTISGNNKDNSQPYKNVQPKEALQLDVATRTAMPGFDTTANMYNGKGCHRVLIKNNRFLNCARGVGSHSGTGRGIESRPYTDINIIGNTMQNLLGEGIFGQDWRNSTISGNTISKARQTAIHFEDAFNIRVNKNKIGLIEQYSGQRKNTYDPNGIYGIGILVRKSNSIYIDNNLFNKLPKNPIIQEADCKSIILKKNIQSNIIKR